MTQTKRLYLCLVLTLLSLRPAVHAAISVGAGGVGPITFATIADTNGWTTVSKLPNSGTSFPDGAALDASSQTNTSPYIAVTATSTPVNGAVTQDTANPPATSGTARWNSALGALATRPTGNSATMLMGEFRNDSGFCINSINLSFDMASFSAATAELPGWHVYYSVTGAAGSWQLIPSLSDVVVTGNLSTNNLALVSNWLPGTSLFLMFADDNGNGVSDPSYTIDNLTMGVTSCELTCVAITNGPASITVPERGAASFSIMATGSPQNIQWYRSDDGGANFTAIPGANTASYSIPSVVYPGDNGARFRATVSNTLCQATSPIATLTVDADTTAPTVISAIADINPVDGQPTIVRLVFSEPMDPVLVNEANFILFQTATDPNNESNPTFLFPFSVVLTNGTNALITTEARQPLTDYSIRMLDQRDASSGNNPTIPNPLDVRLQVATTLISFDGADNEWKYFVSTNVDLWATSPNWMQPNYDDSTWSAGPAPLGNDGTVTAPQPAIRTTISFSGADPSTANRRSEPAFFRHSFFLPSSTNGLTLQLRHFFEDGGVVFINGQEAARVGVTVGAALNFTTRSTQLAEGSGIGGPITLPLTNVFPGSNHIAVVVVQNGDTSSDVVFAAELTAIVTKFAAGAPVITGQPVSQSVTEGANVNFSVSADGALPLTYHWKKNGNPIGVPVDSPSYSIQGVVPADAGNYSVTVSNSLGISNSQIATLTVAADTINPVFVSALGSTNGTDILLTITDNFGLNLQTATNPANYTVSPVGGGGNLTVLSAVQTSPSNILLTTSARTPLTGYTVTTTGIKDRAAAQNPLTPSSRAVVVETLVFPYNGVWKYNESGLDLGTAWQASGYNDSAWPSGAGVLGFEDSAATLTFFTNIAGGNGTNTVLSLTNSTLAGIDGTNITFYFRTTVNVPFDPNLAGNSLRVRAYIDDGAAIYVNGVEQFRFNLTNTANYTNFATAGSTEGAGGIITSNITGFVQGNNVVAVEVHQNSRTSSDVDWAMELEGLVTTFGPSCPKPSVSYNAGTGQVTISWTGAATLQETSVLQTPSSNTVWVNSSRANGVAFTPSGGIKYYRLSCP